MIPLPTAERFSATPLWNPICARRGAICAARNGAGANKISVRCLTSMSKTTARRVWKFSNASRRPIPRLLN